MTPISIESGFTTLIVTPGKTVLKIHPATRTSASALAAAAQIVRDRLGMIDRRWSGNPHVAPSGTVTIVMANRSLTQRRSFSVSPEEIAAREQSWQQPVAA